jgi:GTP diphosphokinase / guanosine-3',5'-bis(diphosphate) 3'-diphosphatase
MDNSDPYIKFFNIEEIADEIQAYLKNFNRERFMRAYHFAEKAHRSQLRKDGKTPYLVHPVSAVKILISIRADEDILISALLHDVPEDTSYTLNQVKDEFGEKVAFLVNGITKLTAVHYNTNNSDSIESLKKMFFHIAKDPRVIIIKLADRLHNIRTLQFARPDKQIRTAKETMEIYVPAANILGLYVIKREMEDACFSYLLPTEFQNLKNSIEESEKKLRKDIKNFENEILKSILDHGIDAEIEFNTHSLYEIYKKTCEIGRSFEYIDDGALISISVDNVDDCYRALGVIHSKYLPKSDKFIDFIARPKLNGYSALHTSIFGIKGLLTDIRIMDRSMRLYSLYGIMSPFFKEMSGTKDYYELNRNYWSKMIIEMQKSSASDDFLTSLKTDIFEDRIVVYSSKGSLINLPKNATCIDFAYALGSEIGNHAYTAIINNQVKPITTILKSLDVVQIRTSNEVEPELYWISFAKTTFAKNKIKNYFNKIDDSKKSKAVIKMLQREFDIAGLGLWKDISFKKVQSTLKKTLNIVYKNWKEVFDAISKGEIKIVELVKSLKESKNLFNFDQIYKPGTMVKMKIVASDRPGLASEITQIIDRNSVNMRYFKGSTPILMKTAYFDIRFFAKDPKEIGRIFYEVRQIPGVKSVNRVKTTQLVIFSLTLIFTVLVWLSNNYLLNLTIEHGFGRVNAFIAYSLLYIELFMPLISVIVLSDMLGKYYTALLDRKILWLIYFFALSASVIFVFLRFININVDIDARIMAGGVILAYLYLFYRYRHIMKTT